MDKRFRLLIAGYLLGTAEDVTPLSEWETDDLELLYMLVGDELRDRYYRDYDDMPGEDA
jgi:hypothetical protein